MRQLTKDEVGRYDRDGYLVVKGCLNPENQANLMDVVEALLAREADKLHLACRKPLIHCGIQNIRKIAPSRASWLFETVKNSHAFYSYIYGLDVAHVVGQLLHTPANMLSAISPNFRMDEPNDDKTMRKWHLDSYYFRDVVSGKHALVMWIPFGPADAHHGTVAVIPKTTQKNKPECVYEAGGNYASEQYTIDAGAVDESSQVIIEANRGDVVFMEFDLVHKTLVNRSDQVRYTAIVRFADILSNGYRPVRYRTEYLEY